MTVWQWLESTGIDANAPTLARCARQLHDGPGWPAQEAGVPGLDVPVSTRLLLESAAATGMTHESDLELLADLAQRLAERWPEVIAEDPLGTAIVHGDLHHNVVVTSLGPTLVDLEIAGGDPAATTWRPSR